MSMRDEFEKWANSKFASLPDKERGLMWRAWQAAQAPASGEVEPVACKHCGGTGDVSGEYPGVACPACSGVGRTHPPASQVPEGWPCVIREAAGEIADYDIGRSDLSTTLYMIADKLTTPGNADTGGDWVEWFGGDQPVPNGTTVELKLRGGYAGTYLAEKVDWSACETSFDIISYRVVRPTPPTAQGGE